MGDRCHVGVVGSKVHLEAADAIVLYEIMDFEFRRHNDFQKEKVVLESHV